MVRSRSGRAVTALADLFERTRAEDRAALIGYLPAGFPTVDVCIAALIAMVDAGVDAVEVGLPYSDPVIDGPTVQAGAEIALRQGTRIADVMRTVSAVAATGAPALVMSYWNPIERYGVIRFAEALAHAGGAGVITPDLTPEEAGDWLAAARSYSLDTVFLAAPSSSDARLAMVSDVSTGFVYAASTMGVTGARPVVSGAAQTLVGRLRAHTNRTLCVGLGVSNGAQAAEVAAFADGVIVGSAFVNAILEAPDDERGVEAVTALARDLAAGVRRRNAA